MTWPPIIRVFFAIEFSPAIQDALHQVIVVMKKHVKTSHIRWTRTENLHVTLKFLPTLNTDSLPDLETKVSSMLKNYQPPLSLHVGPCITFPFEFRPRIIAMEVQPEHQLRPIAEEMTMICNELQISQRDNHEFRPHITLGRIEQPKHLSINDFLSCALPEIPNITIDHITLFHSASTDHGTHHYAVIKQFPLGGIEAS